jgi:hypothetical protein
MFVTPAGSFPVMLTQQSEGFFLVDIHLQGEIDDGVDGIRQHGMCGPMAGITPDFVHEHPDPGTPFQQAILYHGGVWD